MYYNGSVFDGQWLNNRREGRGVFRALKALSTMDAGETTKSMVRGLQYSNGGLYSGEWMCGCIEGRGLFKYADGSVYDG